LAEQTGVFGFHDLGEAGDDKSIDVVGLCELVGGSSVVPDLPWIDDGDAIARLSQVLDEEPLIASCGLQADLNGIEAFEMNEEVVKALRRIGKAFHALRSRISDVKAILGDIDPDIELLLIHHG